MNEDQEPIITHGKAMCTDILFRVSVWNLRGCFTLLTVCAWASQIQALSSGLQSAPWNCIRLSWWALPIKRRRHCLFLTPLGRTRQSPGSMFEDQLWWSCVCIARPASWNRLPATIRSSDSLRSFKTRLKPHFFWWTALSFPFISNAGNLELDSMLQRLRNWRTIIILTARLNVNCYL